MSTDVERAEAARASQSLDTLAAASTRARSAILAVADGARDRTPRPWVGSLGAPLLLVAGVLAGQWPVVATAVLLAWWWSPREPGYAWLAGVLAGAVGVEWSVIGVYCLAAYPDQVVVDLAWCAAPLMLAVVAAYSRTRRP